MGGGSGAARRCTLRAGTGRRAVTGETALRLAAAFGTTPEFLMNLQKAWELAVARDGFDAEIGRVA